MDSALPAGRDNVPIAVVQRGTLDIGIRQLISVLGSIVLAVLLSACGGDDDAASPILVTGVVIAVDGGLNEVSSFALRLADGSDLTLIPADDVLFDDLAPIGHLRDHLASGEPVRVGYVEFDDGSLSAVQVEDG